MHLRILSIFLWIVLCHCSVDAKVQYVSLGNNCEVAMKLNKFGLRNKAYPLDWIGAHQFSGVMRAIETDFKYFLDPFYLEYHSDNITNTFYNIGYNHFFPTIESTEFQKEVFQGGAIVTNYLDYLPQVQQIQNKRIKRLQNLFESDTTIVFIRTHSNPEEAIEFLTMIKRKYPNINAILVIVHERADLIGEWNIPNVLNFYAHEHQLEIPSQIHWWSDDEWRNIFTQIENYLIVNRLD